MEKIRPLSDNRWNPPASAKDNLFRECTGVDESGWIRNAENLESCNPSPPEPVCRTPGYFAEHIGYPVLMNRCLLR